MRPHPKIRRTIKWTGLALSVVLVVVWVGSQWFYGGWYGTDNTTVFLTKGAVLLFWPAAGQASESNPGWKFWAYDHSQGQARSKTVWSADVRRHRVWTLIIAPLWMLEAPLLIITALAWRFDILARRRARMGACPRCGYDLTGIEGAVCPECGRAVPTPPAAIT